MAVTPLRDGMNLVAQEFVLCQSAEPSLPGRWRGALVLSELAGAAQVLPGALLVNPWDVDDIVAKFTEALELDPEERKRRLGLMAGRVEQLDCRRWAETFLARFARYIKRDRQTTRGPPPRRGRARERIAERFVRARRRTLLLDYDGTLRELASHPDLAAPTPEIFDLLRDLAALPDTDVHVVSGRRQDTLEQWFGDLPVYLSAEHGYLARAPGGEWERQFDVDLSWLPKVERRPPPGHGRRPRHARRAQELQRHLALPPGRAGVRRLARSRAARRDRADAPRRAGRDHARSPRGRGARARRQQGRVRSRAVPRRQGELALRPRRR